ncbi:tetratricopeptide repeat protein [Undibacterium sp. Ji50W]|uniref:tetratricopeptide repeat protein n=1 Tax=Undibacterium sp. Ji50W TaxID=3413041 RepID=UPI003BF339FA
MDQRAINIGNGNSIVQIIGEGNPHLTLTRFFGQRTIHKDLDRLSPYTRSTSLIGREAELASLHKFLTGAKPIAARVLIGGGGSGKTRLALHLCDQLSETGWQAGFVKHSELKRFFNQQNLSLWGWGSPTLIVVDYAAEHAALLSEWFDELSDRIEESPHLLRLLLLERHASADSGWWQTVFASGGFGSSSKRALLDPPEPISILPLFAAEDRLTLLRDMLTQMYDQNEPLSLPDTPEFREKLMKLDWGGDPLFLLMASLMMAKTGDSNALSLNRTDLARDLADRELLRLGRFAENSHLDAKLIQHLAACVTLAQGMDRNDFEEFAEKEKAAVHRPSNDVGSLADMLCQALPRHKGIAPVLPDLIGEALILRMFSKISDDEAAVVRCWSHFGQSVVASIIRCAQDLATSDKSEPPLRWIQALLAAMVGDVKQVAMLNVSLPSDSVVLLDINLQVAEQLLVLRRTDSGTQPREHASALVSLSVAQAVAGHLEIALTSAQEAVEICRLLVVQNRDRFLPDLAISLNCFTNRLSNLGRRETALEVAQETTDLYRELILIWPKFFLPALATSLNGLSTTLSNVGKHEAALAAALEATGFFSELAKNRPDAFLPNFAASLNNLAIRLSDLGQYEKALTVAKEAVTLHRNLVVRRPDVFLPDLAASLDNLGSRLASVGQFEQALAVAQEALTLCRTLAIQRSVFLHNLAMSLNNVSLRLVALGQYKSALIAAQEAVTLLRNLASQRPDVFLPHLATSLIVLALRLEAVGRTNDAASSAHEAIITLLPDFARYPGAHEKLIHAMMLDYLKLCEKAEQEPDSVLLTKLLPFLNEE